MELFDNSRKTVYKRTDNVMLFDGTSLKQLHKKIIPAEGIKRYVEAMELVDVDGEEIEEEEIDDHANGSDSESEEEDAPPVPTDSNNQVNSSSNVTNPTAS